VAKGPSATYGGIILGVWEIAAVQPGSDRIDRNNRAARGWAYVSAASTPRLKELRERFMHRRSTHSRQPVPTKIG
jgi:hypothetical protein